MAEAEVNTPWVEYTWLSPYCGIKVSNICLGCGNFGRSSKRMLLPKTLDETKSHEILDRYFELGGNFIDTANVYGSGQSEEFIGSWMKKIDRSSVIVATKVRYAITPEEYWNFPDRLPNDIGLSRGGILTNLERSLRRLQTDYVDLYYSHSWDSGVDLEETLRTFNDVIRAGKVRYFGVSNVTGAQLQKIVDYSKFAGFDKCVVIQNEYNLLSRYMELEVIPTCHTEGVGLLPFSPLKGGLITGRFKRDDHDVAKNLPDTRLAWIAQNPKSTFESAPYVENYRNDENYWKLQEIASTIGNTHGKTISQVAIRWLLQKKVVSSVVIGPKSVEQLDECMGAGTGWKLTDEEMKELDAASAFAGAPASAYPYQAVIGRNVTRKRHDHGGY